MRGNRRARTKPELLIRSELHRLGFRYRADLRIDLPDLRVRPDIVFTRRRIAVFVDGCFWHGCPVDYVAPRSNREYWLPKLDYNRSRDERVNQALESQGWEVLRFWEHTPTSEVVERIAVEVRRAMTG